MSGTEEESAEDNRPQAATRRPEEARKVWAEVYPGGDVMIELGGIDCDKELYLMSGEAGALREVLNELVGQEEDSHTYPVGAELEKIDSSVWKITNRMVDVDTGETLYRLREADTGPRNFTETFTESQVEQSFQTGGEDSE